MVPSTHVVIEAFLNPDTVVNVVLSSSSRDLSESVKLAVLIHSITVSLVICVDFNIRAEVTFVWLHIHSPRPMVFNLWLSLLTSLPLRKQLVVFTTLNHVG